MTDYCMTSTEGSKTNYLVYGFVTVAILLLQVAFSASASAQDEITVSNASVRLIHNLKIPAREAGVIMKYLKREGQMVKAGEVIAKLDDRLHRLENQAAKLDYEVALLESENLADKKYAQKSMQVSGAILERSSNAVKEFPKSISKTDLERAKLENERDQLAFEQAENRQKSAMMKASLKEAQSEITNARLSFRDIRSPLDGMLVERFPQENEWVATGEPVMRIISLKTLRVETTIDATKYDPSVLDKAAKFDCVVGGKIESFSGKVTFASPEVSLSGVFAVWVEIENRDNLLRPGVRGTLTIDNSAKTPEKKSEGEKNASPKSAK